ncbi:MAG: peptide ABC transporter substrate-binding protein [Phycisphaerales bacterium]|nr:peptide ABC transporter substrate-binding protein [Phycisphaerales bacterium]
MVKLLIPILILALAIGITIVGDDSALPGKNGGADFVFINRGDVSTLDLQKMSWSQDLRIGRALFEGLVGLDIFSHEYNVKPGVASRWEISDDKRTYTFHLRADAKWSNGEPVKAGDFVYSWRRMLLPDTGCDYIAMAQIIEGAKEFTTWREQRLGEFGKPGGENDARALWAETEKKFAEMVLLTAVDDRTLRFTLARPTPYFLELLAFASFYPVYPAQVKQYEVLDDSSGRLNTKSGWTKGGVLISNGPYMLTGWRFKRDMTFEKNPHYWAKERLGFDRMLMLSVEDVNAQVLAFRSGTVHWLSDVAAPYRAEILNQKREFYREHQVEYDRMVAEGLDPAEIDRRLPSDPRNRIGAYSAFGTYFYSFNCQPKLKDGRDNPFVDKRVRRAFAMAVDKRRIVDQVRRLGERPVSVLVPPGSIAGYRSPDGLPYDPERARRELAAAGYPGGKGLPTIEILFTKDGGHDLIAQTIKKDWEEHLGVSVELAMKEIKVFRNDVRGQNYMVSRGSWFGDFGDPATFLDLSRKDDGNNDRKYASAEFEDLMNRSDNEQDPAKRFELLHQAEKLIMEEDMPILPMFQYVEMQMFDPHVLTGVSSHPRQIENIQDFDILGDGKGPDVPKMLPVRPAGRGNAKNAKRAKKDKRRLQKTNQSVVCGVSPISSPCLPSSPSRSSRSMVFAQARSPRTSP